jgi:hypothetical protein
VRYSPVRYDVIIANKGFQLLETDSKMKNLCITWLWSSQHGSISHITPPPIPNAAAISRYPLSDRRLILCFVWEHMRHGMSSPTTKAMQMQGQLSGDGLTDEQCMHDF